MEVFGIVLLLVIGVVAYFHINTGKENKLVVNEFLQVWRVILIEKVDFYNSLNDRDKILFESDILAFINEVRITGIDVTKNKSCCIVCSK